MMVIGYTNTNQDCVLNPSLAIVNENDSHSIGLVEL